MDTGTEIRDAVKIVIQQMREHPEEFEHRAARFGWLQHVDTALLGLNEAETKAYNAALAEMRYRKFNDAVLNAMLEAKEEEGTLKYNAQNRYAPGAWGTVDPNSIYGNTISNVGQQYQNPHQQLMHTAQIQKVQHQLMEQQGSSLKPSDTLTSGQLDTLKRLFGAKAK